MLKRYSRNQTIFINYMIEMKRVSEIRIVPEHLVHFLGKHGKSPYKGLPLCSRTRDVISSNHHLRVNCTNVF